MKYLFKALFNDGKLLEQTHEDVSPTTEGRNCFFDVLERLHEVRAFALVNTETNEEYTLDFEDLHFEANGVPFVLHGEPIQNPRLIYLRRNTYSMTNHDNTYPTIFIMGFQANNMAGKNVEHVLHLT